jgi:hypothetical protein
MTREARSAGARVLVAALCLALAASHAGAAAGEPAGARNLIRADIVIAGPEAEAAPVASVVAELLEREGVAVSTSRLDRIRPETILATPPSNEAGPIAAWIDVGEAGEALLYFRDGTGRRFVLRRLALERGLDGVAVEEVGQIVKSVVLALAAGDAPALTIAEARALLRPDERKPDEPRKAPSPAASPLVAEMGVGLLAQLFSPEIALAPRLDLRVALLVDRERTHHRPLGAWVAVGYGEPLRYRSDAIALDLTTLSARAGAVWEPWRSGRLVTHLGIGGGVDLVDFAPRPSSSGATPAAAGRFVTPVGAVVGGLELEAFGPFRLGAAAEVDLYTADVHYDLQRADGRARLLVPYRIRPGLLVTLGATL